MSDVMSVRLHLWGVRVRGVGVDSVDRLEVEVESTREWSRCGHCGFRCYRVWDRRAKRVRDLGVSGRRTTLVWRRRRFECGNCGERHLEDYDQFAGGLTRRFARRLVADARVMSIRAASRHHGVGWHRIMGLVRAEAAQVAKRRRARPCRVLLVDETSIRRRRYRSGAGAQPCSGFGHPGGERVSRKRRGKGDPHCPVRTRILRPCRLRQLSRRRFDRL